MTKNKRNPAIELYRILLMFGICYLHCVCQGAYAGGWMRQLLGLCVPGFVFITGWFGISFSLSKVIRLYSVAFYASLLAPLVGGAIGTGNYWQEVLRVWDAPHGFWFIHAYVILMMLSPLINRLFEHLEIRENRTASIKSLLPLLFVVFVWSALLNYRNLKIFVPAPAGLTGGSFLTFMAVYAVGRYVRLCDIDRYLRFRVKFFVLVALLFISFFTKSYILNGNTFLGVMLPAVLFLLMKDLNLPQSISKIVLFLSPMMFAVYCIHGTIYFPFTGAKFFAVIEWSKSFCVDHCFPVPFAILCAALIAFGVGILFALVTVAFGRLWQKLFPQFYCQVDESYANLCELLTDLLWHK